MIPELGNFSLILALALAAAQAFFGLIGPAKKNANWTAAVNPIARGQGLFLVLAFAALAYAFVSNDFSVRYVAQNSNSALPLHYRISAVWGAHEGSMLLWALILGLWTVAVTSFSRDLPTTFLSRVLGVMGLISSGFLLFLLTTSNPFERLYPVPGDGRDLNPLLQDPGLVIHPPVLYAGYVGFAVAFSFAIAALLSGRLDAAWARWSRPWTLAAWLFLTLGICLGSYWAYYELGWGGWWFWDPVENASFMPWLAGTALLHSFAVTEKRGVLKGWTILLAICVFSLSLLGTFLVRSGVLTSVHAFATDPTRGMFILALLTCVVGASLILYAWRMPKLEKSLASFDWVSRESALLMNNVLLVVAAATILLGTLYPLAIEALQMGKISVGAPYFNVVFVPIMVAVALLLGAGSNTRWKTDRPGRLWLSLRWALSLTFAAAWIVIAVSTSRQGLAASLAIGLCVWILTSTFVALRAQLRSNGSWRWRLGAITFAHWGMAIAHFGFAVTLCGVGISSLFSDEIHRRVSVGEAAQLAGYSFRLAALNQIEGPNYRGVRGEFHVTRGERHVATLLPEKRIYAVRNMPMTEAGIDGGFLRDIYVSMGEPLADGSWSVRLYVKPFVRWIWIGALLMAMGAVVAASDRRYRLSVRERFSRRGPLLEREAVRA